MQLASTSTPCSCTISAYVFVGQHIAEILAHAQQDQFARVMATLNAFVAVIGMNSLLYQTTLSQFRNGTVPNHRGPWTSAAGSGGEEYPYVDAGLNDSNSAGFVVLFSLDGECQRILHKTGCHLAQGIGAYGPYASVCRRSAE